MSQGARVTSIAALREFRPALIKFVEEARAALLAAESDAIRTIEWLRRDMAPFWKREIRRRQDDVVRAKTDLINKQRSATGDPRSAVEERKALERAQRRLEEAHAKVEHTRHWIRQLEKEHMAYKGAAQGLAGQLVTLEERALHDLDRMAEALEQYVALSVPKSEELGSAPSPKGYAQATGESYAHAAEVSESEPSPHAAYRQATPGPGRRRRAERIESVGELPRFELGRVARLRQAEAIAELHLSAGVEPDQWVSTAPGALAAERIYLERCEPTDENDSGWYLGPAPASGPTPERRELDRVRVRDVLEFRPDLGPVFELDRGVLVVVCGARVESVTLPNDTIGYCRQEGEQ